MDEQRKLVRAHVGTGTGHYVKTDKNAEAHSSVRADKKTGTDRCAGAYCDTDAEADTDADRSAGTNCGTGTVFLCGSLYGQLETGILPF